MKKLIFLLTNLLIASPVLLADSCCPTSCESSCASSCSSDCNSSCDNDCDLSYHGQTFRRMENTYQNATPVFVSLFNTDVIRNLDADDKKGAFEVAVFGGKNTNCSDLAAYYFPYGFENYTVDGSIVTPQTFATNVAWEKIAMVGTAITGGDLTVISVDDGVFNNVNVDMGASLASDATTYKFDGNKTKNKLLPWNFGITYAALFEPFGASELGADAGTGLISNPAFKSTIAPTYHYSHVGAGMTLRYHFSDDKQGWFAQISTAVENVKSRICLHEKEVTEKVLLNSENFPAATIDCGTTITTGQILSDNPYGLSVAQQNAGEPCLPFVQFAESNSLDAVYTAAVEPKGSINAAYLNSTLGTGFPADQEGTIVKNVTAPANMAEAFNQSSWKYGKIGCPQSVTRLADIELLFGYQWLCSDCASNNWYVGIVIPTGNKPCATYMAPAVVGNNQHVGLMFGSSLELMLSEKENRSCWYRLDVNCRYLFKNTQKRSFDLKDNEWSRYMMVWANKDAYNAATAIVAGDSEASPIAYPAASRGYTPGINVFTADMKVTPGLQTRLNQAIYFQAEHLRAELGWGMFVRSQECVKFACTWDAAPAFADSSYIGGIGLNNNRTIYNDAQTMVVNATGLLEFNNSVNPNLPSENLAQDAVNRNADLYDNFAIGEDQVNLQSASTPEAYLHTPYATIGYAWESDYKPAVAVGGSYEFSANNAALSQWMVWGKFEFAF